MLYLNLLVEWKYERMENSDGIVLHEAVSGFTGEFGPDAFSFLPGA